MCEYVCFDWIGCCVRLASRKKPARGKGLAPGGSSNSSNSSNKPRRQQQDEARRLRDRPATHQRHRADGAGLWQLHLLDLRGELMVEREWGLGRENGGSARRRRAQRSGCAATPLRRSRVRREDPLGAAPDHDATEEGSHSRCRHLFSQQRRPWRAAKFVQRRSDAATQRFPLLLLAQPTVSSLHTFVATCPMVAAAAFLSLSA